MNTDIRNREIEGVATGPRYTASNSLPIRKQPPLLELRSVCRHCATPLKPLMDTISERVETSAGFQLMPIAKTWSGRYHGYGAFCTLRCGCAYANNVVARKERT